MAKEVRRTNFWWGVGVSALVFVIISVIVLTNRLVKEQPVAQVSCDIQKHFSGCSDLLSKVEDQSSEITGLKDTQSGMQTVITDTQKNLDDLKASRDKEINDAKAEMQKQADVISSELTQCNLIRQKLENVCEGYVCKGNGAGFIYSAGSTANLICPKTELSGVVSNEKALQQVVGFNIVSSFNELTQRHCYGEFSNFQSCIQHYN